MKKILQVLVYISCCIIVLNNLPVAAQNGTGCKLNYPVNDSLHDYAPIVLYATSDGYDTLFFTSNRFVTQKAFEKTMRAEMWIASRPSSERERGKPLYQGWAITSGSSQFISTADYQFATFTRGTMAMDRNRGVIIFAAERALVLDSVLTSTDQIVSGKNTSYLLDLWITTDNFRTLLPLRAVNSEAWDSQPALSPDGTMLFFTSTRPTELDGKLDSSKNIFYSRRAGDGTWSAAELVPRINTPGDEISPHCGSDRNFYYASNWKNGEPADHDIYRAQYDNTNNLPINSQRIEQALEGCTAPECPYNTSKNDCFPFITSDKKTIFFTSDRDNGKYDIYAVNLPESSILLEAIVQQEIGCCGQTIPIEEQLMLNDGSQDTLIQSGIPILLKKDMVYTITTLEGEISEINTHSIPTTCKDTTLRYTVRTHKRSSIPPIVLRDTVGIPYFITGYWWPNTTINHQKYVTDSKVGLLDLSAPFIEYKPDQYNYPNITATITEVFERDICGTMNRLIRGLDTSCCALVVTIHGYTDPRRLVAGKYSGYGNVTVGTIVIPEGQDMQATFAFDINEKKVELPRDGRRRREKGLEKINPRGQRGNIFLSKLRAHFTQETIKQMMNSSPDSGLFNRLLSNNQIQFKAEGFGIFDPGGQDRALAAPFASSGANNQFYTNNLLEARDIPNSRRVIIFFDIVPPTAADSFSRIRGGKRPGQE